MLRYGVAECGFTTVGDLIAVTLSFVAACDAVNRVLQSLADPCAE